MKTPTWKRRRQERKARLEALYVANAEVRRLWPIQDRSSGALVQMSRAASSSPKVSR